MQISASALFFALITGLLGVWLYLWQADRQHTDYRVTEARVAGDKARFDVEFEGNFGKPSKAVLDREKRFCGEFDGQDGKRVVAEEKARKEGEMLKQSIEKALTSEEAQAELRKQQIEQAASAVATTATVATRAAIESMNSQ